MKNFKALTGVSLDYPTPGISLGEILPRQIKRTLRSLLDHPALNFVRTYYSGLASCLLYHRIGPEGANADKFSPYRGLTVRVDRFEEQVSYFKKNFNCLALPTAIELLTKGALPRKSLIITFDDGYKDNLSLALPILEKYEVPATIYVATGLVERTAELWWFEQEFIVERCSELEFEWRGQTFKWSVRLSKEKFIALQRLNVLFKALSLDEQRGLMKILRSKCPEKYSYDDEILTWEEVERLDRHPLITIGAHTENHPSLGRLAEADLWKELLIAKHCLETRLGHAVPHLAYPFGSLNEVGWREYDVAKRCGFVSAVTTRHGHFYEQHQHHLHLLPRISVNDQDTLYSLAWKMGGMYSMFKQRGRRALAA